MTTRFEGRVAVVTGAGGGIGRAHALEIARRGGKVLVNDLGGDVPGNSGNISMAEAVAAEIRSSGGEALANGDSVATSEGAARIVAEAVEAWGKVDVLINNAGNMRCAFIEDLSDEDWDSVIATQLSGSFRMIRAAWPHMKAAGYGRIVNTCSSAGMFGTTMMAAYGSAKAGVAGLTNIAAIEGEPHGILVNAIMPNAMTRMAMFAAESWAAEETGDAVEMPPEVGNSFDPAFNMPIAVYLASEACRSTHGIYTQCLGRIARTIIGVTTGWQAHRQSPPAVEEVAAHWQEICDMAGGVSTPLSPTEELAEVLGASAGH